MIEKDTIRELFSSTLENHTTPVRPEVWNGLQAKMAAAGVTSAGAGAAAKGLSALAKWFIGSAAVAGTAVVTTIAVVNSSEEPTKDQPIVKTTEQTALKSGKTETVPQEITAAPLASTTKAAENDHQFPDVMMYDFVKVPDIVTPLNERQVEIPANVPTTTVNDPVYKGEKVPEKAVIIKSDTPEEPINNNVNSPETTYESANIEFPNIFTPNGDGYNDVYGLIEPKNIKSIEIIIRDEQNHIVFHSNDENFKWDGTDYRSGEPLPEGHYWCKVIYKDTNGAQDDKLSLFEIRRK